MSMVRNVALLGRPSGGPVIASISSMVNSPDSSAAKNPHHAEKADPVADEVGRVLRDDDALAEPVIGEPGHLLDHRFEVSPSG
jgi:hypothetical protein